MPSIQKLKATFLKKIAVSYTTEISKKAVQTISVKILVSVILIKLLLQYEVKEMN